MHKLFKGTLYIQSAAVSYLGTRMSNPEEPRVLETRSSKFSSGSLGDVIRRSLLLPHLGSGTHVFFLPRTHHCTEDTDLRPREHPEGWGPSLSALSLGCSFSCTVAPIPVLHKAGSF
jgi:hypothetical protein